MATGSSAVDTKERDLFVGTVSDEVSFTTPQERPEPNIRTLGARQRARSAIIAVRAAAILEHERRTPALLAPIAMGSGAIVYFASPVEPSLSSLILWVLLLGALAFAARGIPLLRLAILASTLAAAGAGLAKIEVLRADTKVLGSEISTRVTGYIVDIDHLANGRARLLIDVVSTEKPTLRYRPDRIRVSTNRLPADARAGQLIVGPVKLLPPPGPVRPGGYDHSFESYFSGIGATGFFLGAPKLSSDISDYSLAREFRATLDNVRNEIAARIREVIGGPEGEIAAALIVGVRAGIPEPVNESLRRTGLAHILSISGLHMALVAATVMGTARAAFALFPRFASSYPIKKYAAASALLVLSAYLFISGADVAAQRSFIMLAVMLFAVLLDRRALSMRNLAISAVIVLLITPHEIVGPSFQMSFAATGAIVGAYSIWGAVRKNRTEAMPTTHLSIWRRAIKVLMSVIIGTVVTSVVAGLATTVFGVWHFQRVSPLSLLANLAVTPIVSLAVMPFAVLSAVAMPFGVDGPPLLVMGAGLTAMLDISDWLSERSPVDGTGPISMSAVVWFTLALLVATMPTTRLRWASVPMALAGIMSLGQVTTPAVLVSEDARFVAVEGSKGRLLLNDPRSNNFTLTGWKRLFAVEETVGPTKLSSKSARPIEMRRSASQQGTASLDDLLARVSTEAFLCNETLCLAEHRSGAIVAVSQRAAFPLDLCAIADLVIVREAKTVTQCSAKLATVLNARSLARFGAAQIRFPEKANASQAVSVTHAIGTHYRPWHTHRSFSRAARGLEPFEPRKRPVRESAKSIKR